MILPTAEAKTAEGKSDIFELFKFTTFFQNAELLIQMRAFL